MIYVHSQEIKIIFELKKSSAVVACYLLRELNIFEKK